MSVYRRILRGADATHGHWVALEEEKCIGENFHALRTFCDERGLSLSRHGHSVNCDGQFYQVFMFAEEEHAEMFRSAVRRRADASLREGQGRALGAVEEKGKARSV